VSRPPAASIIRACSSVALAFNADLVKEVWLYGSMIDRTKIEVADIDILEITGQPECSREEINQLYDKLFEKLGIPVPDRGLFWEFAREKRLRRHFLHERKKHRLLSFDGIPSTFQLDSPCQLIFSKKLGGRLYDGPLMPRHPDATDRSLG
jgi:predicted nucleotidyltransferase